jgi:3-oxoadipate enol-lactonase
MNTSEADTFRESLQLRALRTLQPLLSSSHFARSVSVGIHTEAACRAAINSNRRVLGLPSRSERRGHQERLQSPAGLAVLPGRRVPVNWHEGGSGPALLLLNGWTASGLVWPTSWVRELEQRFRVLRIDNRGTGWSRAAPAPYTLADLADDADDVLGAAGVDDAVVLGTSMGGMVAQELALRHPERVRQLVLVSTAPPIPAQIPTDPAPFVAALARPEPGGNLHLHFQNIWAAYAAPEYSQTHPEVFEAIADQVVQRVTPRRKVLDQLRAVRAWQGPERLRGLGVPTTVVHGDLDPLIPVGNGMRLSRLIPGARYVEMRGAGHLLAHEAGEELVSLIGVLDGPEAATTLRHSPPTSR